MSNKKKLLIYAHYYIPDTASTGQILRELAEGMLDKFNITVICVVPSYLGTIEDKYKTQKYYEEEINGVKVLRIRVPEFSKTNKKSRVKNIVSYFFGAMGATFKVGKMDYVFSISQPPILGGLLGGDVGHVVGGIDHEGDAVNGEGECFQAEFFNFLVLQRAARVADLDEPFAHLLYAHAGTAARHGDADIGIGGHDAFGGFLHDRDMGGASGDIQSAFHAFKGIKGGGHGGGGQKERCGESGEQELFHGVLTRYE